MNPGVGNTLTMNYDGLRRLSSVTGGTYTYDNQGQLTKAAGDKTYTYTYDTVGNIKTVSRGWHAMTALYTNGSCLVFSRYNQDARYREYTSLDEAIGGGRWIYGIRIDTG